MTLLKIEYTIVSFKKTPQGTFDECVDQWFYARFCPAPRIFTLAPPRRFLPLPLPAPPHRKMFRPAHPCNAPVKGIKVVASIMLYRVGGATMEGDAASNKHVGGGVVMEPLT